jgi:hypothetical protein
VSARKPRSQKQAGLRIRPTSKLSWDRLPFVGKDHGRHSCWDVPLTGSYLGGCEVGKAIAHMYLKYVRDERDNHVALGGPLLHSMIQDLVGKDAISEDEQKVKRGQIAGFASELASWLKGAACELGYSLDRCSEQTLVDRTNRWLDVGHCNQVMQQIEQGAAQ